MSKKTTRRAKTAKKLGIAVDALPKYLGMDKADATALKAWNAAMDAEEDDEEGEEGGEGKSGMTLEEIADMLTTIAEPLGGIQAALAAMGGGAATPVEDPENPDGVDDMEPMMDSFGKPVMDPATGKPKMQKKAAAAAPAADAVPSSLAACDAAVTGVEAMLSSIKSVLPKGKAIPASVVAMDAQIKTARKTIAALRVPRGSSAQLAAMDARLKETEKKLQIALDGSSFTTFAKAVAGRDTLYGKVSAIVGAFDHAEMDKLAVAKYAMDKLGVKAEAGSEIVAVENYIAGRLASGAPAPREGFGLDAAGTGDANVLAFLAGKPKAA